MKRFDSIDCVRQILSGFGGGVQEPSSPEVKMCKLSFSEYNSVCDWPMYTSRTYQLEFVLAAESTLLMCMEAVANLYQN